MCSNQSKQQIDGLGCLKVDIVQKHRKKDASIFPDIEELSYPKAASDNEIQCDFMQLSPDCKSPSLLSPDDSKDHCLNFCIQECFPSMLSLSGGRCGVTFDTSMISPTDEASFVLDRQSDDSNEEHVIRIKNAIGNELEDHSGVYSESHDSSSTWSCCDDSSMLEGSSTPLSTQEGTPCARDFDTTGIWVSSLDLDMEDSDLVQGKEQGFPSLSFGASKTIQFRPFSSAAPSSSLQTEVGKNLSVNCDSEEPLFWPFAEKSYCLPEFDNFLCLSPRKDVRNIAVQELHASESVTPRQHNTPSDIYNPPNLGKYNREECRRRIVFSPPSNKASGDCKTRESNKKSNRNISTTASKLSKLSRSSSEKYQCNMSMKGRSIRYNAKIQEHNSDEDFHSKPLLVLEAGIFQKFVAGVPILIWRQNSSANEQKDYFGVCSESGDSSCTCSICDDSSIFEGSSTTVSTQDETTYVGDYDTTGIWVSSVDLHMEDPELLQASSEKYLCNISMKEMPLQRDAKTHCKPLRDLESCMLQNFVAGVSIETLVGLNEFDGHEGINVEFNESELNLDR